MLSDHQLRRWLMREVWGTSINIDKRKRVNNHGPARNWKYRAWVRSLPSAVSGLTPCQACHTGPHAVGQKSSDYSVIPLTHTEHMELDRVLGPRAFETKHNLNIAALVERLNSAWWKMRNTP